MFKSDTFRTLAELVDMFERLRAAGLLDKNDKGRVRLYVLWDPRDETVRYVGVTSDPERRKLEHAEGSACNRALAAWVAELRGVGLVPELKVIGRVTKGLWEKAERRLIKNIRRVCRIYNIAPGGLRFDSRKAEEEKRIVSQKLTSSRRALFEKRQQARELAVRRANAKAKARLDRMRKTDKQMELGKPATPPVSRRLVFDENESRWCL